MTVSNLNDYTSSIVTQLLVKKCLITSAVASLEFKDAVVEFAYYEDIFTNAVSGTLLINDSSSFPNILSWCGEERLDLEIGKPGTENTFSGTFRIYNISKRHLGNDNNENYLINFCSEELVLSEKTRIAKTYKNTKISDIVKDIAFTYLKIPKSLFQDKNIEETFGNVTITIPNLKPFEAINWLCTRAIAGDTKFGNHSGPEGGASYLFWRNSEGYHFKSLLAIFNSSSLNHKYSSSYRHPYYNPKKIYGYWYGLKNADVPEDFPNDPYSQIISYQILNSFDALEAQQRGMFCNRTISLDIISREYKQNDFDYNTYFNDFLSKKVDLYKTLNTLPIVSNAMDRFGKTENQYPEGNIKIYPSTTNQVKNEHIKKNLPNISANYVEHTIPHRLAQMSLIGVNRIKISIPGDPFITIGKLIDVYIPQATIAGENKKLKDKFLSGTYLVTCVRHTLDQENEFKTILEVAKDAYSEVETNNGLSTFSATLLP